MQRWIIFAVMAVLVLATALPSALAWDNAAQEYYQQGQDAFLRRELDKAVEYFTQAVQLDPRYIDAYNARGYTYVSMGQFDQAIADANQVLGMDPQNAYAYAMRAFAYYGLENTAQAMADVEYALQLDPNLAVAYNTRGALNLEFSPRQALADFTRAAELDPHFAGPFLNLGDYYYYAGDYHKAVDYYTQAIQANSLDWRGYFLRGDAYSHLRDYSAAIADYSAVIQLQANSPDVYKYYLNRAISYLEAGNMQAALPDAWEALRRMPGQPSSQLPLVSGVPLDATLSPLVVYHFPFDAQAGQTVSVTLERKAHKLIPLAVILDPNGNPVALTQDLIVAASVVNIPATMLPSSGMYTLVVADVNASDEFGGPLQVILTLR